MDEDEIIVFVISGVIALGATPLALGWPIHRLFRRRNAAAGVPLPAMLLAMGWISYVIRNYADPSVRGIYAAFYFVLGMAIVSLLGWFGPKLYGLRIGVDVYQRKNTAAVLVIAAFMLATAMIYSGSVWGEADPVGDDEGGWWIPLGFFALGWGTLIVASALYITGEPDSLRMRLVQNRSHADARAAASYLLGVGVILTEAVAGDFWGWTEGILGLAVIAGMLATHRLCSRKLPLLVTTVQSRTERLIAGRTVESLAYAVFTLAFWILQRGLLTQVTEVRP